MNNLLTILLAAFYGTASAFVPDHSKWDKLLKKYTEEQGQRTVVLYSSWKTTGEKELDEYLNDLSSLKKKEFKNLPEDERLALLINAYNAFTVKLILNHFPVKSIKDTGGIIQGPWEKKFFVFLEEKKHLDNIEHDMIRKDFHEPRIHFAVNCASVGCPELNREAFTGPELKKQLSDVEKKFFMNPEKIQFEKDQVKASKIFEWYGKDFGEVDEYIFKKGKEFGLMKGEKMPPLTFLEYDWDLNGK